MINIYTINDYNIDRDMPAEVKEQFKKEFLIMVVLYENQEQDRKILRSIIDEIEFEYEIKETKIDINEKKETIYLVFEM